MANALLVRLRPFGPWRFGPLSGSREETATIGHSDTVYLALTAAMERLGHSQDWHDTFAYDSDPAVRVSSLFPFAGRTLFAVPPRSIWPPAGSPRVRWKTARFVPVPLIGDLLAGRGLREERWEADFGSGCLISAGSNAPFRVTSRRSAGLDRQVQGVTAPHAAACLEFAPNAGMWTVVTFRDDVAWETWRPIIESAFRLLADSGIGGERGRGWGISESVEFQAGEFPRLLLPESGATGSGAYWLLSTFLPASLDHIDWTSGAYGFTARGGLGTLRAEMAVEGSVLQCETPPVGRAVNAASPEQKHSRMRAGFAVAVPLPGEAVSEAAS